MPSSPIRTFAPWVAALFVVTLWALVTYAAVQQTYRQSANDPQIQMAEDGAVAIAAGTDPRAIVPTPIVDIKISLAPFVMVFDQAGNLLASNATLNGQSVQPPAGVVGHALEFGSNRVTWQPRAGVRLATVAILSKGAREDVVVVGRSLRETEDRVSNLGSTVFVAWTVSMALVLAACWLAEFWPTSAAKSRWAKLFSGQKDSKA